MGELTQPRNTLLWGRVCCVRVSGKPVVVRKYLGRLNSDDARLLYLARTFKLRVARRAPLQRTLPLDPASNKTGGESRVVQSVRILRETDGRPQLTELGTMIVVRFAVHILRWQKLGGL